MIDEVILGKVNNLSSEQINEELSEVMSGLGTEEREKIKRLAEDICYTKRECALLRIPYLDVRESHFRKAKLVAYHYLMEDIGKN